MKQDAIVTMFDDKYFEYGKALIESLVNNYPDHPEILVFYDGSSPEIISYLNTISNLRLMPYTEDYYSFFGLKMEGLNLGLVNNYQVFFKYILWSNLFDDYNKILYMDADTLVTKPLDSIFEQDVFFCISDCTADPECRLFFPHFHNDSTLMDMLKADNIRMPEKKDDMMNAGVFLMPSTYRQKRYFDQLLEITYRYNRYTMLADQSAISLWCHFNNIKISRSFEYNFQVCFFFDLSFVDYEHSSIHILHYTWWKPSESIFKSYVRSCNYFLKLNDMVNNKYDVETGKNKFK